MRNEELLAVCERLLATNSGEVDSRTVARALKAIIQGRQLIASIGIPRKGPQMADEAHVDPVEQVQHWLMEYLEYVKAQDLAKNINHSVIFRMCRTMYEEGKTLEDMHKIIQELAKSKQKPRHVGYLITVIESRLGRVA